MASISSGFAAQQRMHQTARQRTASAPLVMRQWLGGAVPSQYAAPSRPTSHLLRPAAARHRSRLRSLRDTPRRGPSASPRAQPFLCRCKHPRHRRCGRPASLRLGLLRQGQGHSRTHRRSASPRRIRSLSLYPKSHVQRRHRSDRRRGVALRQRVSAPVRTPGARLLPPMGRSLRGAYSHVTVRGVLSGTGDANCPYRGRSTSRRWIRCRGGHRHNPASAPVLHPTPEAGVAAMVVASHASLAT